MAYTEFLAAWTLAQRLDMAHNPHKKHPNSSSQLLVTHSASGSIFRGRRPSMAVSLRGVFLTDCDTH